MNPINLETVTKPQLSTFSESTDPSFPIIEIIIISGLAITITTLAFAEKKTLKSITQKIDKHTYRLATIFSILSGILLVVSPFFGFGTYLSFDFGGMFTTIAILHRNLLPILIIVGISILFIGLGNRKISKENQQKTANLKVIAFIITAIILFYTAILVSSAHPAYYEGNPRPYWDLCFFEDLKDRLFFTQIIITTTVLLGITQIIQSTSVPNSTYKTTKPKNAKIFQTFQLISGTIFVIMATLLTQITFIFAIIHPIFLMILYLFSQIFSAIIFFYEQKTKT